jgi:delta1-piperideine-2-carboxylate reductase
MVSRLPFSQVQATIEKVLSNCGYSALAARIISDNCARTIRDGSDSHELLRVGDYEDTIKCGYANGDPTPRIEDVAAGFIRVDADNGFAQIALEAVKGLLVEKAKNAGIAVVAIRNSHHLGSLYLDIEEFADEGFIALALANSYGVVAPPGGKFGVYGTNPIAFAAPRANGAPLVFDQSTSTTSFGAVVMAAREGRKLADGTGIDKNGNPTGDPDAIIDGGALATFGGYKGASISLMIEIMCAALVGCDFSFEVTKNTIEGAKSARSGQTIVLIDPRKGAAGWPTVGSRVEQLARALAAAGQGRLPGDRRLKAREALGEFIDVKDEQWKWLLARAT